MKCPSWCNKDSGMLLIRIGVGIVFIAHGVAKLQNMEGTIGFFASLGFPSFLAWLVALTETIGGAALILGIWTPMAATALAITMAVVVFKVKAGKPFMGGYEFEFVLMMVNLGIAAAGAGKWALMKNKDCVCVCHPGDKRCGADGKCGGCGEK